MLSNVGLTNQSVLQAGLEDEILDLASIGRSTLILQETGGVLMATVNEQALYVINTPMTVFAPRVLFLDLDAMAGGDTTIIRVYYKIADGGGWRQEDYLSYAGADGGLANGTVLVVVELLPCRHGVEVTLQQTVGALKTYPWSVVEEALP